MCTTVYDGLVGYKWMPGILAILNDIEPHEITQALTNPRRWPRTARGPHGITYIAVFARTNTRRPIVVVLRHLGGHDSMIVAARPMTPLEIAALETWEQDHE